MEPLQVVKTIREYNKFKDLKKVIFRDNMTDTL